MTDNARDILELLRGRHLTREEAKRITAYARDRIRVPREPRSNDVDAHGIKRGVISK